MLLRNEVQGRLDDLRRPFRAKKVIPALQEHGATVTQLIEEVQPELPFGSSSTTTEAEAVTEDYGPGIWANCESGLPRREGVNR